MSRMKTFACLLLLVMAMPLHGGLVENDLPLPSPPLALADDTGRIHTLEQYRGQVLIVNFWASWCTPCVRELPGLNRLRENFGNQPFEILGVNVAERPRRLTRFLKQHPVDFPVLYDRNSAAFDAWNVTVLPTSFVVDRDGNIHYRATGALEWDSMEMIGIIDELLAGDNNTPVAATP